VVEEAEKGLVEDWSGGKLVACLVRVLNDENGSDGLDRRKEEGEACGRDKRA